MGGSGAQHPNCVISCCSSRLRVVQAAVCSEAHRGVLRRVPGTFGHCTPLQHVVLCVTSMTTDPQSQGLLPQHAINAACLLSTALRTRVWPRQLLDWTVHWLDHPQLAVQIWLEGPCQHQCCCEAGEAGQRRCAWCDSLAVAANEVRSSLKAPTLHPVPRHNSKPALPREVRKGPFVHAGLTTPVQLHTATTRDGFASAVMA